MQIKRSMKKTLQLKNKTLVDLYQKQTTEFNERMTRINQLLSNIVLA